MTLIFFACFVIPAMVIAVCYIVIAVIIWKKSKAMEAGSDSMCNLRDGQGSNFHTLFGMLLSFLTYIYRINSQIEHQTTCIWL